MKMTNKELEIKIKGIKEMQRIKDEADKEIKKLQDEIKAEMTVRQVKEIITDEYKVRYTDVTTNRFDTKTFKSKYLDLYNQFIKPTSSMRFSINQRTQGKKDSQSPNKKSPMMLPTSKDPVNSLIAIVNQLMSAITQATNKIIALI